MSYLITVNRHIAAACEKKSNLDSTSLLSAAHQKLEGNEFKVYFGLIQIVDSNFCASRSLDELKVRCNIRSRTTLIKALDSLVGMGMLRRIGEKRLGYTYQLTQVEDWVNRTKNRNSESVLRRVKTLARKAVAVVVQKKISPETELPETELPDSNTPPLGGCVESEVVQEEESKNCSSEIEPNFKNLDSKVEAVRNLGCNIGTPWINGEQKVAINHAFLSIQEFMEQSLESFKQIFNPEPPPLCWQAIGEKLKMKHQRIKR